jgi:ribonuclease P protein component
VIGRPRARLRRIDRLRSSKDFARVRAQGTHRNSSHFVAQIAPARDRAGRQLGLVVSKRIGGAVQRNRVKRRIREWFRQERAVLSDGSDLVVIARRGAADLTGAEIACELSELLR